MKRISLITIALLLCSTSFLYAQNGAARVSALIWANGNIYDTIVTPAAFIAPPNHSVDALYDFSMSGLQGQRLVSDSAPGDGSYNGGRWSVKKVIFTAAGLLHHDADFDGLADFELTSEEEILAHETLGHLTIMDTTTYFECPLLPHR